jgi:hypothetical protein
MGIIKVKGGQPSYTVESDRVKVAVTVQGGHLTARFNTGKGDVDPFFTAPWWTEADSEDLPRILKVLRGDFFCFPFGGGEDGSHGITCPPHGQTANDPWDFQALDGNDSGSTLELAMDLDAGGRVLKRISVKTGEPVIYTEHRVEGFTGSIPLGYHPTLKLPDRAGAGIIDMSPPVTGFTTPERFELPEARGYSRLALGAEITDRKKAPTMDGSSVDITRYPTPSGYEDLALFVNDPEREFSFTSASLPEEGYLYFQLKNPRVLAQTLFWMSNGGRHYAPWSGRVRAVLGMEEITSYFHYGIGKSTQDNDISKRGYPSSVSFDGSSRSFNIVMGVVPIDRKFKGVADIRKKNGKTIEIVGTGGEHMDVPCEVGFLL